MAITSERLITFKVNEKRVQKKLSSLQSYLLFPTIQPQLISIIPPQVHPKSRKKSKKWQKQKQIPEAQAREGSEEERGNTYKFKTTKCKKSVKLHTTRSTHTALKRKPRKHSPLLSSRATTFQVCLRTYPTEKETAHWRLAFVWIHRALLLSPIEILLFPKW